MNHSTFFSNCNEKRALLYGPACTYTAVPTRSFYPQWKHCAHLKIQIQIARVDDRRRYAFLSRFSKNASLKKMMETGEEKR